VLYVDRLTLPALPNDQPNVDGAREREGRGVITDGVAIVDPLSGRRRHSFAKRGTRF
jgi:hypothetical protein